MIEVTDAIAFETICKAESNETFQLKIPITSTVAKVHLNKTIKLIPYNVELLIR